MKIFMKLIRESKSHAKKATKDLFIGEENKHFGMRILFFGTTIGTGFYKWVGVDSHSYVNTAILGSGFFLGGFISMFVPSIIRTVSANPLASLGSAFVVGTYFSQGMIKE